MGMVASDFYSRFTKLDIVEAPISVGELMDMASIDVQGQFAAWTAENEDTCYVPAEILTVLLEDRAFFARLTEMIDGGEYVVLSGVTLACKSVHIDRMGLTPEDARENILTFFDKSEEMTYSIESILAGTNEWVSGLYVFANGWVGIETERMMDAAWDEDEQPLGEGTPEPAASYLIDSEGELIASPDIRFDIEAWMDFVDMFSAVHEEATAADSTASPAQSKAPVQNRKDGYIVFSDEVEKAMAEGRPVVVIESAATFGGMMYPGIAEFAFRMRKTVRDAGAVPAFTAILNGQIHVGLTDEEILYLEERRGSDPPCQKIGWRHDHRSRGTDSGYGRDPGRLRKRHRRRADRRREDHGYLDGSGIPGPQQSDGRMFRYQAHPGSVTDHGVSGDIGCAGSRILHGPYA